MAEKGKLWSDRETQLLLQIWSEGSIQSKLKDAKRNEDIYVKIAADLKSRGFTRTADQCRSKIKALKKKYKSVADQMRRSGAGRESDEEADQPVDFPYFEIFDAVMGGRAAVIPVHLLDSAASSNPAAAESDEDTATEAVGPSTAPSPPASTVSAMSGPAVSHPTSPSSAVSPPKSPSSAVSHRTTVSPAVSRPTTPSTTVSRPTTPSPAVSCPTTPSLAVSSRPATTGPSGSNQPSTSLPDDDVPVPKKKRKRLTSVQRAEKAATSLLKEVLETQAKGREAREEMEKELAAKEELREKRAEDREQQYMQSMTAMMSVMSQFVGSMMYGVPPPYMPGAPPPVNVPPPAPFSYPMYPYAGPPPATPTPTTAALTTATTLPTMAAMTTATMPPTTTAGSINTDESADEDD